MLPSHMENLINKMLRSNWNQDDTGKFYYNNRFEMAFGGYACGPKPENKLRAIERGLPNPVITVAEYMDTSGGGFQWATKIPQVGSLP